MQTLHDLGHLVNIQAAFESHSPIEDQKEHNRCRSTHTAVPTISHHLAFIALFLVGH